MFVYDNGNLSVLAMKKCGHIAMLSYFDVQSHGENTLADWLFSSSSKVVVVRHPVERMHAAINWNNEVFISRLEEFERTGTCDQIHIIENLINYDDRDWYIEEYVFNQHCRPYMKSIQSRDFRIIKFEDLSDYIPKFTVHDTKTQNRDLDPFPTNRYFQKEDMLQEIEAYETVLATKEVITPEEWKALT